MQATQVRSLGQEELLEKEWQPTPVFLPGESRGQRSLAGYGPWGHKRVGHYLATKQQQNHSLLSLYFLQIISSLLKLSYLSLSPHNTTKK